MNALILISLLKEYGIHRVIASPGTTNMALVASMQHDPFFKIYSCVDERSAAYIACGMSAESGEPVVISCTGATASRNYLPGMTEAYYRKLPVLAITSTQSTSKVGHHVAQVIDNSQVPKDTAKLSITIPVAKDNDDIWDCEIKVNHALLELTRHGGGPVHLNLQTTYSQNYTTKSLPKCRRVHRITTTDSMPRLPEGKIGILVGAHKRWTQNLHDAVEKFCKRTGAAVFCDHTSGYAGIYKILTALLAGQKFFDSARLHPDLLIYIGETTGDYCGTRIIKNPIWRVSPDGVIRDAHRKLTTVFEMPEADFFNYYSGISNDTDGNYFSDCQNALNAISAGIPEVPFSNIWTASVLANKIPSNSTIHFGILNSLRAWNFFPLPPTVESSCNVGGFGIDGALSTALGASLCKPDKLFFCVIGDLAFFYDLNALGNRHVHSNIRILLINNGRGTEFRQYGHIAEPFGDRADPYISAAGHFGNQSPSLVRNYTEALGFEYLSAANKDQFVSVCDHFTKSEAGNKPMVFEVFTNSDDESKALELMLNINTNITSSTKDAIKGIAKAVLGKKGIEVIRKIRS